MSLLWGSAANAIWAVGPNGLLLHYAPTPPPDGGLDAGGGAGADAGLSWQFFLVDAGTDALLSIWGSSSSAVWAVGNVGTTAFWNGTAWTLRHGGHGRDALRGRRQRAERRLGRRQRWCNRPLRRDGVVERRERHDKHALRRLVGERDGGVGLPATAARSCTTPAAPGRASRAARRTRSTASGARARRAYGPSARPAPSSSTAVRPGRAPRAASVDDLYGVWGSGPGNVFAVGSKGTIVQFAGSTWALSPSGSSSNFVTVWGSPGGPAWAGGASGALYEH